MEEYQNAVKTSEAKKKVIVTSMGNAIEWFDFALYAQLAIYISHNFFSDVASQNQLLFTFGTFAIAFLMRPIGALVFGYIGDKKGRKVVLTTTISIMAISTLILGLLPTSEQIGVWAPILLLIVRMAQSFSTGGEYSGAMTYIVESSPDKKRGMLTSGLEMGTMIGNALAAIVVALLLYFLNPTQIETWGWRVPFLLAAPFGIIVVYLRFKLDETPTFKNKQDVSENNILYAFKKYKKEAFLMTIGVIFLNVNNFMFLTYLPSFLKSNIGIDAQYSTIINAIALILMLPFIFLFGTLSDKYNNKRIILFGLTSFIFFSIPVFLILDSNHHIWSIFLGVMMLAIMLSIFNGVMPSTLPAITHTNVRMKFLSIIYNLGTAIFGGVTPFILSLLSNLKDGGLAPAFYLIVINLLGLIAFSIYFKPTSNKPLKGSRPNIDFEEMKNKP
ncbi:MFS transporter [Staphylococcus haemolyticus]|uniref:MFS transporter n=1 Tax=Staphylococcus devriesei TaxID=586733 RepID=A0ABX5HYG7_9STAP|nr:MULTISPECIES: MFS transporter [Staphylococcus]MCE4987915.1 MFS transporter [Staphylococcus haemolyticus]MCE5039494.1 MFS transporter [Staphylococcus auricularis]MDG6600821.1 MFS transporter [Staphylococcus aureus]MDG6617005.1 MFS transporter [Staphylococcus aureus]MDG6622333.1 MFS transporter [Staphylococcus aureus]